MAICEKCGKEFDAKGDWQKVCIDCYKASAQGTKIKYEKKATNSTPTPKELNAQTLRKAYDCLVAEFSDVLEDVKPYLGGWTTTIALSHNRK